MRFIFRFGRAIALPLSLGLLLAVNAGDAFAKKGGLDDSTRSDDDRGSKSGSSSSGSGSSGGSSGGSGGSANSGAASGTGGREGYDRVSTTTETASQTAEQKFEASLDERTRNVRDEGDRFR